jgi:hypothetical protein
MVNETSKAINLTQITNLSLPLSSTNFAVANEAVDKLVTEGGDGFYNYLNWIGLANTPDLIVLSSLHHYYYDSEEMKNVKTLIHLKELNQIINLKSFLYSHLNFLPLRCNFIGCFVDTRKDESYALRKSLTSRKRIRNSQALDLGIVSRFPFINKLYSFMDSKADAYLSEKSVTFMLGSYGFKVMDMTEFNGLTYFHAQKVESTLN